MSRQWQKLDYQHPWAGLVDRRQRLDYPLNAASIALNCDFFGGSIGKRLGSQYVNGWGTRAEAGWTTSAGDVEDASGFDVTDTLTFYYPDGSSASKTIDTIVTNTITLDSALTVAPGAGTAVIARRPLGGGAGTRVGGLFQANFRDGTRKLLAAAGAELYAMPALGAGGGATQVTKEFPATTVLANWGSTTTGTLTSVEGLEVGDKIVITGRMGTANFLEVTSITALTRTVVVAPAAATNPQINDVVTFYPLRIAGDTHFVQHNNVTHIVTDHSVLGNGNAGDTPPLKYCKSGANYVVQRHGIKPPVHGGTVPSGTAASGGKLRAGDYSWRVKFLNSSTGQESEPGPEIAVAGVTLNQKVNLANLPVSVDPQVDKKRLYRSMVLPSGESAGAWYFEAELADATTTYASGDATTGFADTELGTLMREFLDVCIPDGVSNVTLWPQANRLVGVNSENNTVVFSDQFDVEDGTLKPEAWPADNFIFVSYDDGDPVRAVAAFYDSLIVFKERSVFKVSGIPPEITIEPVIFRHDLTGVGSFNAKAIVVDQNEMIFPADDGVYVLSRWEGGEKSFNSSRLSREIDNAWASLRTDQAKRSHAVFFRARRQYRLFLPILGYGECRELFTFQFEGSIEGAPYGWARWGIASNNVALEITASCVGVGEPDANYIATSAGDVVQLDVGTADLGAFPISFDYATAWTAPAGKGAPARGRALDLTYSYDSDLGLAVTVETDFTGGEYPLSLSQVAPSAFMLGTSVLDVDPIGVAILEAQTSLILRALGEYHRIHFSEYSAIASFSLQNWTYWFQALPEQAKRRAIVQDRG